VTDADEPDRVIRDLAHALRTPLAVIQGFAELLLRDPASLTPEQQAQYADRIRSAAGDMRDLLDEATAAARGE
jgi:signal transduction histidine kinase